ncbi:MAG: M14 family metallopeptidase [Alphaproteobacteria bacterium]
MTQPYAVELTPPDITPYRTGNTGVDYVHTFTSDAPGPHVMVNAVTHGNELCGAIAVDELLRKKVRPLKGRLTLSFANVEAYLRFDPAEPTISRYVEEDFNRIWSPEVLDGPRDSVELQRGRELRPIIDTVDYLFDIHSMQTNSPPMMMAGPHPKGRKLSMEVGAPATVVSDAGHREGTRMRDYGCFGDPDHPRNALLVECGQHWTHTTAEVALEVTLRFLGHLGVVAEGFARRHLPPEAPPPQRFVQVTEAAVIETSDFAFVNHFEGLEVIARKGTTIAHDGGRELVTPYDDCVLIMPTRRIEVGKTAVRFGRYVDPG